MLGERTQVVWLPIKHPEWGDDENNYFRLNPTLLTNTAPYSRYSDMRHYSYITWASWHLKSPVTLLFVQHIAHAKNKKRKKTPYHWPFVRIIHHRLRGQYCRQYFHVVTSHYNDVIMSAIASQITSLTIVYPTVYSGADWPLCGEFTGDRWPASNAEHFTIWWRHTVFSPNVHWRGNTTCSWLLTDLTVISNYLPSNLWYKQQQIPKPKCFSPRLTVVFAQSIEARC